MLPGFRIYLLTVLLLSNFAFGEAGPAPVDKDRELARSISSMDAGVPHIKQILVNGESVWSLGQTLPAKMKAGDSVVIRGTGFGEGPDIDFSKVLIGKMRAIERDMKMYKGKVKLRQQKFYEEPTVVDHWDKDILSWTDSQIVFQVPVTAHEGPLVISVQKRVGNVSSLQMTNEPLGIWDSLTERIEAASFVHEYDVVSRLGEARLSEAIPLDVENACYDDMVKNGESIFWNYDDNVGIVQHFRGLDWEANLGLNGQAIDPVTQLPADPTKLFGAIPLQLSEVPKVASEPFYFDPYPIPNPIHPLFRPPLTSGLVWPTGYVGYTYSESINPATNLKTSWIGFSCISCHGQRISYEAAPGKRVDRVFAGLPNPQWSMKWTVLGNMGGVKGDEPDANGNTAYVDKTLLLYSMPDGTGEHSLVRAVGDSRYGNDNLFSPIAIPIITRHTPLRRALSRTEMIVGFEGSYIHSEEPDGGVGALRSEQLKQLTAYMGTLDKDDDLLERLGLYRWLAQNQQLDEVENVGEGDFLTKGQNAFPKLVERIERGQVVFNRDCRSCHQENFGTYSDEDMRPLTEVGTYFSPTIYQQEMLSIRTSMLRDLFWVQKRGLLHDGHVKSLEDLVDPNRCVEGTELYNKYYTLTPTTFKIPKGNAAQELALRRHAHFSDVSWDSNNLYWDYQEMRSHFGVREFGLVSPVAIPAAPHPWCTQNAADIGDLVRYLLTL